MESKLLLTSASFLRYARVSKKTYLYGKRDLFIWQKRSIHISMPEVCVRVKRGLLYTSKETYYINKRDLLICWLTSGMLM